MEEFADVAKARASYKVFTEALASGREIMRRAGVPDPPPIPEFDTVFRRLSPELRRRLFSELKAGEEPTPGEAIKIWQPLIRQAFAGN